MSQIRYASITSSLLARKGDAAPSIESLPQRPPVFPVEAPVARMPAPSVSTPPISVSPVPVSAPPPDAEAERRRRIALVLTAEEYERLGIAAAKRESTRHRVLRQAMEDYLARLSCESGCACIGGGTCCG